MDEAGMIRPRPLPAIELATEPYWEGAKEGKLMLAQCDTCSALSFPPELSCTSCGANDRTWIEASGKATLWSWTECHPPMLPWFAAHGTWLVGVAELEEGPRIVTSLADMNKSDLAIGMDLTVRFEAIDDDIVLPVFGAA